MRRKKPKQSKANGEAPATKRDIAQLGTYIERISDNVRLIAEQYGDIKSDVTEVKETLNDHIEMIEGLTADMAIVKQDIEFIKSGMKQKVDVQEFAALERCIVALERKR